MLGLYGVREFLPALREAFVGPIVAPTRAHHEADGTTLLLMPAWNERFMGVKTVTVSPGNRDRNLPSVHATYTLFEKESGVPLARFDGKTLTNLRTSAASALACDLLAPRNSERLIMVGTGSLAPDLIRAHCDVRPIRRVRVYGRDADRAARWVREHEFAGVVLEAGADLGADLESFGDIVSVATTSSTPVLPGERVREGTHVDLVGSYQRHTREGDDDLMARAWVLLDTEMAMSESGDIALAMESGALCRDRILGTLGDVLRSSDALHAPAGALTVFKSVGVALEDLALAEFLYEKARGTGNDG